MVFSAAGLIEQNAVAGNGETSFLPTPVVDLGPDNRPVARHLKTSQVKWLRHERAMIHEQQRARCSGSKGAYAVLVSAVRITFEVEESSDPTRIED